jgi:HD-GYP domain-containing protein (c-di-GMP phosphodiesterase class II)
MTGGGYPDGVAGEASPVESRIICACDAYSAMTTDRPYRAALSVSEAAEELRACAGSQFDPDDVVTALIATMPLRA